MRPTGESGWDGLSANESGGGEGLEEEKGYQEEGRTRHGGEVRYWEKGWERLYPSYKYAAK